MRHRAHIHNDGRVSLVSDSPSQSVRIVIPNNPIMRTIELSKEEMESLLKRQDRHSLHYDSETSEFMTSPLADVS